MDEEKTFRCFGVRERYDKSFKVRDSANFVLAEKVATSRAEVQPEQTELSPAEINRRNRKFYERKS